MDIFRIVMILALALGNLLGLVLIIIQDRQTRRLVASMRTARAVLMCGNCNESAADAVQELSATLIREGLE